MYRNNILLGKLAFAFIVTFTICSMPVGFLVASASELVSGELEGKVHCEATINENFADERVLVVLNNKTSLQFNDYSVEDFPKVALTNVTSLMEVDEKQIAKSEEALNEFSIQSEDYHQILSLELKESGKENVISAIQAIEKMEVVYYACPDYAISIASTTPDDYNSSAQWAMDKINLPEAWDITTGSSSVVVGVMDSGIDGTH